MAGSFSRLRDLRALRALRDELSQGTAARPGLSDNRVMQLTPAQQQAVGGLARDLGRVFGGRLESLVAYPGHDGDGALHSLAVIEGLTFRDLAACLPLAEAWQRRRLAVPLMLSREELRRTVDIFPLEYASIIAAHAVIAGASPFDGIVIDREDLRRACEAQAKSHLIHLREAFLESHGETRAVAALIAASAAPFRALLTNIARLPAGGATTIDAAELSDESLALAAEAQIGIAASAVRDVLASATTGQASIGDPSALLARAIDAAQRVWDYVDRWR